MVSLLLMVDRKSDSYDTIFVIIDCLIKMVYYKSIKIMIDIAGLAKVIFNMIVRYYSLPESIISN